MADVDNLLALDSDPEVMRFLSKGRSPTRERIEQEVLPGLLAQYDRYPGFGWWAAEENATGSFAGWMGLQVKEDRPSGDAELGYRLRRAVWGRGFATEGSRALVALAFADVGVQRVWAETMAVNKASRRVMEKVGLRFVRTFHLQFDDPVDGTEFGEVEYALTRADYEETRATSG
jgi:RimJ/RimL family protein N-acetyltransferase